MKFKFGDIVECSGEGLGRFWRITAVDATGAFLVEANGSGYPCGWKDFAGLKLAKVALKERIRESKKVIRNAERELRAISKNPAKFVQKGTSND